MLTSPHLSWPLTPFLTSSPTSLLLLYIAPARMATSLQNLLQQLSQGHASTWQPLGNNGTWHGDSGLVISAPYRAPMGGWAEVLCALRGTGRLSVSSPASFTGLTLPPPPNKYLLLGGTETTQPSYTWMPYFRYKPS